MTWSLIANTLKQGVSGSTTSSAIDTTGADLLVVFLQTYEPVTAPTLTDNKSNTWNALTVKTNSPLRGRLYYATNVAGKVGSGHTFNIDEGGLNHILVQAWSGAHLTAPLQTGENGQTASSATSIQLTSSVGSAGDLIIVGAAEDNGTSLAISGNNFTHSDKSDFVAFDHYGVLMGYDSNSGAGVSGAENPTVSWSGSSKAVICGAAFKPAAAASTYVPKGLILPAQFGIMQFGGG